MKTDTSELDDWKAKHGADPKRDVNHYELRMLAEEKLAKGKSWCIGCDVHMPIKDMKLITRAIDPYLQTDEGPTDYITKNNRVRMCAKCFDEQYGDGGGVLPDGSHAS